MTRCKMCLCMHTLMRVCESSGRLCGSGRTDAPDSRAPPKREPHEDTHGSVLSKLRKPPEMHAAIVLVGATADTKRHLCNADKESASVKAVPGAVVAGLNFGSTIPGRDTRRRFSLAIWPWPQYTAVSQLQYVQGMHPSFSIHVEEGHRSQCGVRSTLTAPSCVGNAPNFEQKKACAS